MRYSLMTPSYKRALPLPWCFSSWLYRQSSCGVLHRNRATIAPDTQRSYEKKAESNIPGPKTMVRTRTPSVVLIPNIEVFSFLNYTATQTKPIQFASLGNLLWVTLLLQQGWTRRPPKVSFNPYQSMILHFKIMSEALITDLKMSADLVRNSQ